jgi:hypothetical protein
MCCPTGAMHAMTRYPDIIRRVAVVDLVSTAQPKVLVPFFLIHRLHSISFTRAQGIPKYKIGFGRGKDGRVGERLVEWGGVGVTVPVTGCFRIGPQLTMTARWCVCGFTGCASWQRDGGDRPGFPEPVLRIGERYRTSGVWLGTSAAFSTPPRVGLLLSSFQRYSSIKASCAWALTPAPLPTCSALTCSVNRCI